MSDQEESRSLTFISNDGDSGLTFVFECPSCDDEIKVAEYGWWDTTCSCGLNWDLDIKAVGEK